MRKYKPFPYTNGFCLPCCLQSVLAARNLEVPGQKEIASYFEVKDKGLVIAEETMNRLLLKYSLRCKHRTPVELEEPDLILANAFNEGLDVLAAYSYDSLFKTKKPSLHVSLIADFNEGIEKEVLLFDSGFPEYFLKRVSLPDLVNSILATKSANSGFYLIG